MNAPGIEPIGIPHDTKAELAVIGSLLIKGKMLPSLGITQADFYNPGLGAMFEIIGTLSGKGQAADAVTVRSMGGDQDLIVQAMEAVPHASRVASYAEVVRDASMLRQQLELGMSIRDRIASGASATEIVAEVSLAQAQIAHRASRETWRTIYDAATEAGHAIAAAMEAPGGMTGLPTGYRDIDRRLAGLQPSDLIILAARPSMGKTSLALGIALGAALNGRRVCMFSLEMSAPQIARRIIAARAGVEVAKLRTTLSTAEAKRVEGGIRQLEGLPFWVDDSGGLSAGELRARAVALHADHPLDLVVVDYLQLMREGGRDRNRVQELGEITGALKSLAKAIRAPILCLSQLSRASETREDKRPKLADLRDSGAIEQDADVVLMLHREPQRTMQGASAPHDCEVLCTKQRNGPVGADLLLFDPAISWFPPTPGYNPWVVDPFAEGAACG